MEKKPQSEQCPIVLLVDDDQEVLDLLSTILDTDFHVVACRRGRDGLQVMEDHRVAVVLADQRMPDIRGTDFLSQLADRFPDTVRILISGQSTSEDLINAINQSKVAQFIQKPFDAARIRKVVHDAVVTYQMAEQSKHLMEELSLSVRTMQQRHNELSKFNSHLEGEIASQSRRIIQAYEQLRQANLEMVKALAEAIEAKDPYTKGHCSRVCAYTIEIADALKISSDQKVVLEYASLLHDVGKIGVQTGVLGKVGQLTDEEYAEIKLHPVIGENILRNVRFFHPILPIVRHHHERFDGKGYPDGLLGEDIPLFSRIIAVVDAFDAMTSDRPYRNGLPMADALNRLMAERAAQFDPDVVDIFIDRGIFNMRFAA